MSAYGKVSFTENENVSQEVLTQEFNNESVVEEQVNKFDTTYTADKLQELYNEYDKITLDQEKINSLSQVKTNVVTSQVPFRVVLLMSTTILVTLLLAFLCIYNIFVINGISSDINYLQEEVTVCEYDLVQSEGIYEKLTDTNNIQSELKNMGFGDVASSNNVVAVSIADKVEVIELEGQTNWFDAVCDFISRIFR